MKKKIFTRLVVPILITLAVIFFFFRDISPGGIKENFLKIPLHFILAFILLSLLATWLRALKYHILLHKKLSFSDVFLITLVRNFSVDLLPARTASLILYTYMAKRKGLAIEEGATSFVVSIFYDALALAFMLGGLIFFLAPGINRWTLAAGMGIENQRVAPHSIHTTIQAHLRSGSSIDDSQMSKCTVRRPTCPSGAGGPGRCESHPTMPPVPAFFIPAWLEWPSRATLRPQ